MKNIISICGSMHALEEMERLRTDLVRQGFDVHMPEADEKEVRYISLPQNEKPAMKIPIAAVLT